MQFNITAADIDRLPNTCLVCHKPILDKVVLHRLDNSIGYIVGNIGKAHKSCHRSYHAKLQVRNINGVFTTRKAG
jgi:hypothetical protein